MNMPLTEASIEQAYTDGFLDGLAWGVGATGCLILVGVWLVVWAYKRLYLDFNPFG